ncbi:MAG TPA: hypothetical protein VFS46_03625 [Nitrososphaera sp.]|nr:hypothetical protein [Nitrososphaera sp.]
MQEFIDHLKKGEFRIPICASCGSKAWPPSRRCQRCLRRTSLKKVKTTGTLIEFSNSHIKGSEGAFGLVEMAGIRLVASFGDQQLNEGMKVRMNECGIKPDGTAFYLFEPAGLDVNIRRSKSKRI